MRRAFGVALFLLAGVASAATYYASPAGSGTTCLIGSPCTIDYLIANKAVAGDTVYLRSNAGTYHALDAALGWTQTLKGTAIARIRYATYPGDQAYYGAPSTMATINCDSGVNPPRPYQACLSLLGSYVDIENIKFIHTTTNFVREVANIDGNVPPDTFPTAFRFSASQAAGNGIDNRIINCVFHDVASAYGAKAGQAYPSTIYGNIIYNYGWGNTTVNQTYGQGIYSQNGDPPAGYTNPGTATLKDNIVFGGLPDGALSGNEYAYQIYGGCSAMKRNYLIDGNFTKGTLIVGGCVGGGSNSSPFPEGVYDQTWTNNVIVANGPTFGYNACGCTNLDIENNEMSTGSSLASRPGLFLQTTSGATVRPCIPGTTMLNNRLIGSPAAGNFAQADFPTNTYFTAAFPTVSYSKVRPNLFTPGRCNVYVMNYHDDTSVNVDLTTCGLNNGATYEIRQGWDYDGSAVATGTYDSGAPNVAFTMVPANLIPAAPYGTKLDGTTPYESYPQQLKGTNIFYMAFVVNQTAPTVPTATNTPTITSTPSNTATPTLTPSFTPSQTNTPSATPTGTIPPTVTRTPTFTPSQTPTLTPTPSAPFNASFPVSQCVKNAPVVMTSDPTSFVGQYASSTVANNGSLVCQFTVPATTVYRVWAHVWRLNAQSDSWFVDVNGDGSPNCVTDGNTTCTHIFDANDQLQPCSNQTGASCIPYTYASGRWNWNLLNDRSTTCTDCVGVGTERDLSLTAGSNTITLRAREVNGGTSSHIDYIIVTSDMSYDPGKAGEPTPTPTPGAGSKHSHRCNGKIGWHSHPNSGPHRHVPCPWK